jgi:uncharacterized YigZ family protein
MPGYQVPQKRIRIEYQVSNSLFITTVERADTVEDAKAFIQSIRDEMPDATHHVYAFKVGYGQSVTEGMTDDGEPSGTAGPPTLSVVRGADIGNIVLVTTRYFGGTKLGTGGLVHAYGQAAREALKVVPLEEKITRITLGLEVPYHLYEQVKILINDFQHSIIQDETFAADVTLIVQLPEEDIDDLSQQLLDLSAGQISPIRL